VEIGFSEEEAKREAQRCLRCWINTIFEGNEERGTECILCGGCVDVCPENCLELVPLVQLSIPTEVKTQLVEGTSIYADAFQHLGPEDLPSSEGAMMVKDETICIRCGLCAQRCPAHTITMEAFEVFDQDPEKVEVKAP
jgi:NAD-dependent dihydropyrimidine dehydrogenase PreA subunit